MSQFDINGFDEMLSVLDRLGQFDRIAPQMMEAGMEILQEEVVNEASKHKDTGEMVESIKPTGISKSANGSYYMCTRPTGYASERKWRNSRKGHGEGSGKQRLRNMEKLLYLEYGVKGRPATPVIKSAVIRAEPGVVSAMRKVFELEVGRL